MRNEWSRKVCLPFHPFVDVEAETMIQGMNIRWDYFVNQYDTARYVSGADGRDNRHIQFVREFASVVSILQDKTNSVIDLYRDITRAVEDLATCSYTAEAFSVHLNQVQSAVSHFIKLFIYLIFKIIADRSAQLGRLRKSRSLGGRARPTN